MKHKRYDIPEAKKEIIEEKESIYGLRTYISLFSSAGVGCYGFKQQNYQCIATVEILEKRLKIQQYNRKCAYDSGYICGDMTIQETKDKVFAELKMWERLYAVKELDVLIATPPCQGMSVANHKKGDELKRNSLVVESLTMTSKIKPRFFVFENVRGFLNSICTDADGQNKTIRAAIDRNLAGEYNILFKVVNFKDYGNPSSRTRTLVIGIRKDIKDTTPYDIFPDKRPIRTLREVIGHLPALKIMGETSKDDIYHNFRRYNPKMVSWIENLKEGQGAFDNEEPERRPHTVINGKIVFNKEKNSDKYTRQNWDKVAPCIHTRNDILASQNTVHPVDNRVFSIRELMLMMSVPASFEWSDIPYSQLNMLPEKERQEFLKKEEMNIRQNIGEAVPTVIFEQIARKIRKFLSQPCLSESEIGLTVNKYGLEDTDRLIEYIETHKQYGFSYLSKLSELANAKRDDNAAFYTRQDICYAIVKGLPDLQDKTEIHILEPSIGVGNFFPVLFEKYSDIPNVYIDAVDIDLNSLCILKALLQTMDVPSNFHINFINDDFLIHSFDIKYDVVIGNPPYKKITKDKLLLSRYKANVFNKDTNNIFSFFIEKAISLGDTVSLIVPKSLINAPEFNLTRALMNRYSIDRIIDFGEKGFKNVKIETVNFTLSTKKRSGLTRVESYITHGIEEKNQSYIADKLYPYWLLYRNSEFDNIANNMQFGIFSAYRDRCITKNDTKPAGKIRVLKSRNIGNAEIIDIPGYDCYIDDISSLTVSRFLDRTDCFLVPNLSYNPRVCKMPKGCIADGSVAILTLLDSSKPISSNDVSFYATNQFKSFYSIARNKGSRSLNIDNNSVFFFGKLKQTVL